MSLHLQPEKIGRIQKRVLYNIGKKKKVRNVTSSKGSESNKLTMESLILAQDER